MLRSGKIYLISGLVLAFIAVVLALVTLQRRSAPVAVTPTATPFVPAVVAARDVPAGNVLTQDDVAVVEADPASIAPGTASRPDQVLGLVVAGDLVAGQRILLANLVLPSVANAVQPGKRAIAIPVDRINALGGLIQPNDFIDLVYAGRLRLTRVLPTQPLELTDGGQGYSPAPEQITLPTPDEQSGQTYPYPGEPGSRVVITDTGDGQPVAKIVLQKLRVLQVIAGTTVVSGATPATATQASEEKTPVTPTATAESALPPVDLLIVEADPQQAELITFLLDEQLRYQVILRARGDGEEVQTDGVTYDRLVEERGVPVPAPAQVSGGPR